MTTFYADNLTTPSQQNQRLAQIIAANFAATHIIKITRVSLPPAPVPAGVSAGWLIEHT